MCRRSPTPALRHRARRRWRSFRAVRVAEREQTCIGKARRASGRVQQQPGRDGDGPIRAVPGYRHWFEDPVPLVCACVFTVKVVRRSVAVSSEPRSGMAAIAFPGPLIARFALLHITSTGYSANTESLLSQGHVLAQGLCDQHAVERVADDARARSRHARNAPGSTVSQRAPMCFTAPLDRQLASPAPVRGALD